MKGCPSDSGDFVRAGEIRLSDTLLRREGWKVNRKRVLRLYRLEGLQLRRKRRRLKRESHGRVTRETAVGRDERWSMDFVTDRLENGSYFWILTVVDQYTRECLATAGGAPGTAVHHCGQRLGVLQPRDGLVGISHGIELDFIRPGKPVENAYIESFDGRLRDECLNTHRFMDAQAKLACWQKDHNEERPHGNLGSLTPAEFARKQKQPDPTGKLESRCPVFGELSLAENPQVSTCLVFWKDLTTGRAPK